MLCITSKPIGEVVFDADNCNDWRKSTARKLCNSEFSKHLDKNDLLPITLDLTADNGDTKYGSCHDYVGILSCDQYRKYCKFVPTFDEWMWTCTPWRCGTSYFGDANHVRLVYTDGSLRNPNATGTYGLAPACIFHL